MKYSISAILLICINLSWCVEICPRDAALHFGGNQQFTHYSSVNIRPNLTLELIEGKDTRYTFTISKYKQSFILNEFEFVTLRSDYFKDGGKKLFTNIQYNFNTQKYTAECVNTNVNVSHLSLHACRIKDSWIFVFIRDEDSIWLSYQDMKAIINGMIIAEEKLINLHMICDVRMQS